MFILSDGFIYIRLFPFAILYLVYFLLSHFIYFITSGGWKTIAEILYWSWILPLFWIVLILARFWHSVVRVSQPIFLLLVIAIFILFLITTIFNIGDCYDGGGTYNFLQHFFNRKICSTDTASPRPIIPLSIVYSLRLAYYILHFILVIIIIFSKVE